MSKQAQYPPTYPPSEKSRAESRQKAEIRSPIPRPRPSPGKLKEVPPEKVVSSEGQSSSANPLKSPPTGTTSSREKHSKSVIPQRPGKQESMGVPLKEMVAIGGSRATRAPSVQRGIEQINRRKERTIETASHVSSAVSSIHNEYRLRNFNVPGRREETLPAIGARHSGLDEEDEEEIDEMQDIID